MNAKTQLQFLNVDLDLYSRSNLEPLITILGQRIILLSARHYRQTYEAHLELSTQPRNADAAIRAFAALIIALPKEQRKLWDKARIRNFSIGMKADLQLHSHEILLAHETVATAARLKAQIVFTIYAPAAHNKNVRTKSSMGAGGRVARGNYTPRLSQNRT